MVETTDFWENERMLASNEPSHFGTYAEGHTNQIALFWKLMEIETDSTDCKIWDFNTILDYQSGGDVPKFEVPVEKFFRPCVSTFTAISNGNARWKWLQPNPDFSDLRHLACSTCKFC